MPLGSEESSRSEVGPLIPDSVIEEIRGRVDAVAVIGRHVELKKSGRTWKGCCVFHGERTPSFHVYPEDGHFKCYGCGEHGDVFKFLQKLQGKEFPEVVRALAAEVGVDIPEAEEESAEQKARRRERAEVLLACEQAARYWSARLASRHGAEGRRYLESRGIGDEALRLCHGQAHGFDLLITDIVLVGMRGGEVAERVRQCFPGIRVIYMTGYADQADTPWHETGAPVLMKPFAAADLLAHVRGVLATGTGA